MVDKLEGTHFMRIYVIGAPGAGKSFLCGHLETILGIPWVDLNSSSLSNLSESAYMRQRVYLCALSDWIFEAVYPSGMWCEAFNMADLIINVATPWPLRVLRILTRAIAKNLLGQGYRGQEGRESCHDTVGRVKTSIRYNRRFMPAIQAVLAGMDNKIIRVRDNREVLMLPWVQDLAKNHGSEVRS